MIELLQIGPEDKRLALTAPKANKDLRVNINGRLVYAWKPADGYMRIVKPDIVVAETANPDKAILVPDTSGNASPAIARPTMT